VPNLSIRLMMINFLVCWLIFLASVLLLFSVDYGLRLLDGDIKTGGINIVAGVIFIIIMGVFASYLQYRYLQTTNLGTFMQIGVLALQGVLGFIVFAAAGFIYTIKFGIDSL